MTTPVFNSRSFLGSYTVSGAAGGDVRADHLLGRVEFGMGLERSSDPRHVLVAMDSVSAPHWGEQWVSERPVEVGHEGGFGYSHNGEVLFGNIYLPESELVDLERATLRTYVHLQQLLQHQGYPHLLRMWNFLAGINAGAGDHERYRQFSSGRARALALKPDFEQMLPAGTAIGMTGPGLVIYFLAGKAPGLPVENPRQVSAYRYPRQYGPRSPSFARATLIGRGDYSLLLISGTASVVGHESRHLGSPLRQLDETIANLDALVSNTLDLHFGGSAPVQMESLKLYVREPGLYEQMLPHLHRLRGPGNAPLLCLHGDICREDLLLEAEAVVRIDAAL